MVRLSFDELKNEFERILLEKGFDSAMASEGASIFAENSLDGIYSHGVNRFPRVVEYIEKGYIKPDTSPEVLASFGAIERWNGNLGLGPVVARRAMDKAIELSKKYGIGCVAIQNTNHWMRGGTFAWQAADAGCVGICWTNTMPNMPAWGAQDRRIGNNPIVFSIPREEGKHVVADIAMAQFSYGQMEATKLRGEKLPVPGGYDTEGNISTDPAEIEKTWRVLPIGFWKGSGMSIAIDLIATVLSGGNSVYGVGKLSEDEYGLSQVLIAIDPEKFGEKEQAERMLEETIENILESVPVQENGKIFYPGEIELNKRKENSELGIPVHEEVWNKIKSL